MSSKMPLICCHYCGVMLLKCGSEGYAIKWHTNHGNIFFLTVFAILRFLHIFVPAMMCNTRIRLYATVQMLVVLFYLSSITLFVHSHIVDGEQIVHSHIYCGTSSEHSHTTNHVQTISRLAMMDMCVANYEAPQADVANVMGCESVYSIVVNIAPALRNFGLRAPPAVA